MKENEKASLQILKITIIALIIIFSCNIAVRAFNNNVKSVKIVLTNNYELNVITTKTKISEILDENHIVVLPDETVFPTIDSEIGESNSIKIMKVNSDEKGIIQLAQEQSTISVEQVLGNYATIVEKIEIVNEVIPFETITKNSATETTTNRTNKVIQEGVNGLKKVTYKVKYQNDIEISRMVVKEEIIKEAKNKIIQITKTPSRDSGEIVRANGGSNSLAAQVEGITPIVKTLNASAYTASTCDKSPSDPSYGITASGAKATAWYTVAAGKCYPMGTIIYIPSLKNKPNGGWFIVQDRGGAISNNKLDIYMNTYNECIQYGRRNIECYIYIK